MLEFVIDKIKVISSDTNVLKIWQKFYSLRPFKSLKSFFWPITFYIKIPKKGLLLFCPLTWLIPLSPGNLHVTDPKARTCKKIKFSRFDFKIIFLHVRASGSVTCKFEIGGTSALGCNFFLFFPRNKKHVGDIWFSVGEIFCAYGLHPFWSVDPESIKIKIFI